MLARLVGKHITEKTGQMVIVDNRPGANGMLGSSMVAKSAPDGYTIGIATPGNHAANASLYKDVPYDTIKDFSAVTMMARGPVIAIRSITLTAWSNGPCSCGYSG